MSAKPTTVTDGGAEGGASAASDPAGVLGDVWGPLDALPRARAAAPLTASTLEMVAAEVDPAAHHDGSAPWPRRWLGPVATVFAALVCGLVAGRISAPPADDFLLCNLPLARHLDLLRELHSVDFLDELARTRPTPPRRLLVPVSPLDREAEQDRLTAEIAALRGAGPWGDAARGSVAARRWQVASLEPDERDMLQRAAADLADMPRVERRRLERVAAAIVDPRAADLHDAARLWRLWVAASDPRGRDALLALDAAKRLEWMRRESRIDGFGPPRPRSPSGEFRRPQGGRFPDGSRLDGPVPDRLPKERPAAGGAVPEGEHPEGQPSFRRQRRGDRQRFPDGPDLRVRPLPIIPDPPGPAVPPPADVGETRAAPD
ncbi:MAG: hypothetical protein ACK6CT_00265 [Planctomycetia bacterium]|jgi:hypothetical protein